MPTHVLSNYGAPTGQNGIYAALTTYRTSAELEITLPDAVIYSDGATGTLYDGLVACKDTAQDVPSVVSNKRYLYYRVYLSSSDGLIQKEVTSFEKRLKITTPLPSSTLLLNVAVTFFQESATPRPFFPNFSGSVSVTVDAEALDAEMATSIVVPNGSVAVRLLPIKGVDAVGALIERVELEIPARSWLPETGYDCSAYYSTLQSSDGNPACVYHAYGLAQAVDSTWTQSCSRNVGSCPGYRADCPMYRPRKTCAAFLARQEFLSQDGVPEVTENNLHVLLSAKNGFGLVPAAFVINNNAAGTGAFGGMDHASKFYCHLHESPPTGDQVQPCWQSASLGCGRGRLTDGVFWRYVQPDNSVDLEFASKNHNKITLRTSDVPATKPAAGSAPTMLPENVKFGILTKTLGSRANPFVRLPQDLPEGFYEAWFYYKHTLPYTVTISAQQIADHRGTTAGPPALGNAALRSWTVPQQASLGWAMAPNGLIRIAGGDLLTLGVASSTATVDQYEDTALEFSMLSCLLRRVS